MISQPSSTASPRPPALVVWRRRWTFARVKTLAVGSVRAWIKHRCSSKGAAFAFYALLSMAPLLLLVIGVAGAIFGEQAAQGELLAQLRNLIGERGAVAIEGLLAAAGNDHSGWIASIVAVVILIVGATSAFAELAKSLDELWEAPAQKPAGIWGLIRTRLLSFGLVLVLALLLLVSLVVSTALNALSHWWGQWFSGQWILLPLTELISFVAITLIFAAIYKLLPSARMRWPDVWQGAIITAALFILGKYAIGTYLGRAAVTSAFGAAGSLVVLMLWVYFSAQIFFLGAEFTRLESQESSGAVTTSH